MRNDWLTSKFKDRISSLALCMTVEWNISVHVFFIFFTNWLIGVIISHGFRNSWYNHLGSWNLLDKHWKCFLLFLLLFCAGFRCLGPKISSALALEQMQCKLVQYFIIEVCMHIFIVSIRNIEMRNGTT